MSTRVVSIRKAVIEITKQLKEISQHKDRCVAFLNEHDDDGWRGFTIYNVGQNKVFVSSLSPTSEKSWLEIPPLVFKKLQEDPCNTTEP